MPVKGCNWTTLFAVSITRLKSMEKGASGVPTVACILKKHFFIPFLHFSLNTLNAFISSEFIYFSLLFRGTAWSAVGPARGKAGYLLSDALCNLSLSLCCFRLHSWFKSCWCCPEYKELTSADALWRSVNSTLALQLLTNSWTNMFSRTWIPALSSMKARMKTVLWRETSTARRLVEEDLKRARGNPCHPPARILPSPLG